MVVRWSRLGTAFDSLFIRRRVAKKGGNVWDFVKSLVTERFVLTAVPTLFRRTPLPLSWLLLRTLKALAMGTFVERSDLYLLVKLVRWCSPKRDIPPPLFAPSTATGRSLWSPSLLVVLSPLVVVISFLLILLSLVHVPQRNLTPSLC